MSLAAGTSLGGYEIVSLLGEGGMGEVYRARDPRLERDVAIKVLTAAGANDAELLRRLRQEAKTIAALNHPNLLSIFDLGATPEGAPFLVMELLQGETLRARLHQGPLPLRRALAFGRQLADALAAAHEQGIIHRDLKPENIFLLADGRIKILDFGLAKALRSDAAAFDAEAPTVVGSAATMPGMVLGTVGYMAPEQVRGEAATSRSDIFAFGAILYEMLAGRRAFAASSSMEVMSAILRDDPPEVTMAGAALPAGVDRLLRRCLEKEPRLRFQNAADLGYALSSLEEANSSTPTRALPAAKPRTRRRWWELAVAVLAGAALTAFFVLGRGGPDLTRIRYSLFVAGNVASRGA
ncbi:MAG: serine/threonine-protein kinase [Terriglobales bacterium]